MRRDPDEYAKVFIEYKRSVQFNVKGTRDSFIRTGADRSTGRGTGSSPL